MKYFKLLIPIVLILLTIDLKAQIKVGITYGGDFYQNYRNPKVNGDSLLRSSGNYWLNIAIGPKIWYKGKTYSLSIESPYPGKTEFSIGAGIQYNKTEINGFKREFKNHPQRDYFRTYVIDLGLYAHPYFLICNILM